MEVILVRHTSVDVPKGTCYGQTDVPLAPTFEQEAAETKKRLACYLPFDRVYSSPLTRARLLAAFCGYPQPTLDNRLKEMSMGAWEMQRYEDISDPYLERWYADYLHLPTPGGESFVQQLERVSSFLDDIKTHSYERVAVFAHGGVLACASIYSGRCTMESAWEQLTPYGGVIAISI
jgi:alpha-ribazole phosphatase